MVLWLSGKKPKKVPRKRVQQINPRNKSNCLRLTKFLDFFQKKEDFVSHISDLGQAVYGYLSA